MSHRPAPTSRTTRDLARRRRISAVSGTCLAVALLAVAPSAWAAEGSASAPTMAAPASSSAAQVPLLHVSPADAEAAVAFWTPERRATAVDVDSGQPMSALATSDAARPIARAEQVAPVPHIGRIFYNQNGSYHACSANVVVSGNRSTIATAGHCITQNQSFSTDIVFYPGFEAGNTPYGAWPVVGGAVTPGWYEDNSDQKDDSGFLAVDTDDSGRDVTSVVGASPVRFDQPGAAAVSAYGYPAALRFDGEHLERCRGLSEHVSAEQIALSCDMNEGVSETPIFQGDDADGAQFANVAERYGDYSHILGPIWQAAEHMTYDTVAAMQG